MRSRRCCRDCGRGGLRRSTVTQRRPANPRAQAGDPDAPPGPKPAMGRRVTYSPVRNAAYSLERHDSLTLQYPGGASQQQVRDRIAFLHVTIARRRRRRSYQVTIVPRLARRRSESGQPPVPPIRWLPRGAPAGPARSSVTATLSALQPDRAATLTDELAGHLRLLFPALPAGRRAGGDGVDRHDRVPLGRRRLPRHRERGHHVSRRRRTRPGQEGDPARDQRVVRPVRASGRRPTRSSR